MPRVYRVYQPGLLCCIATRASRTGLMHEPIGEGFKMDDLTRAELDQLLAVFRDQSLQILEEMGQDLLALESGSINAETMARLRRAAHTIKGDSACIGLRGVAEVAHKIEDVFDAVLSGSIAFDRRSVGAILNS